MTLRGFPGPDNYRSNNGNGRNHLPQPQHHAHVLTEQEFIAFLRRASLPWYRRVNWAGVLTLAILVALSGTFIWLALIGLVTVLG